MRDLSLSMLALCLALPATSQAQDGGWTSHLVGPRAAARLASPELEARLVAISRLGARGDARRAVAVLLERLDVEENVRARHAILESLARRGDTSAVGPLASHLADQDGEERAELLQTVAALGGEQAIRVLVEWLAAPDVGETAADGLIRIGAPAVPHLHGALLVPAAAARAARALGGIADTRSTPLLAAALLDAPPASRVAIIEALAAIGDDRATPTVAPFLRDPSPEVVAATLRALGALAGPELASEVAALADRGTSEQRAEALRALIVMAPEVAAPRALRMLGTDEAPALLRRVAIEGMLAHPAQAFLPALDVLLEEPATRGFAAEALSRVSAGAGLGPLLDHLGSGEAAGLDVAVALTVRRHEAALDVSTVAAARARLREDGSLRGAVVSALARDAAIVSRLTDALASPERASRARGALGLALLGEAARDAAPILSSLLPREADPTVFREMAAAALRLRAPVDPARIDGRWWDAATAPESLWLSAQNRESAAPRTQRRLRRAMRRALTAPQPRVRAGAALALALANEGTAWRALVAALEDEHDAVRLAAARALSTLAVPEAIPAIAARERVERDERVAALLRVASRTDERRPPPAFGRGADVLYVRVVTAGGFAGAAPILIVDLLLPDGRWLRAAALDGGEVLFPALPAGHAEVQVRMGGG